MTNGVTIRLTSEVSERTRAILAALPRMTITDGTEQTVTIHGVERPLIIVPQTDSTTSVREDLVGSDRIGLVVAERLPQAVRVGLEESGWSYADGTGVIHLQAPGLLFHVEQPRGRGLGVVAPPRGIGAVGVRIIQTLLAEPRRNWGINELAAMSGASTGQVHNVIQRLDGDGLIRSTGAGPARRRQIEHPGELLDWLARVPAARKTHAKLNTYLYAPDPQGLIARLADHANRSGITWALTGAAAAKIIGITTMTALPVVTIRVPSKIDLTAAAGMFNTEPVESGPNVVFITDIGDVGIFAAGRYGPVMVAPPVRVWLDMLNEPRGGDAAEPFRQAVLGY